MSEIKTNVMRLLEREHIPYLAHEYPHGQDPIDGETVAALLGQDVQTVFKTLVTRGTDQNIYVFVIPVNQELDLKKAAKAAGVKSIAMLHVSELTKITGYVRGGCSPIGMKKKFPTFFDNSAKDQEHIIVSAGKIGYQIDLDPKALAQVTGGSFASLTV